MRTRIHITALLLLTAITGYAQLIVTPVTDANTLAQKLVGNGVTVFNASMVASPLSTCTFVNSPGNQLNIVDGIALSTGRVLGVPNAPGLAGTQTQFANNSMNTPGDPQLSQVIGGNTTYDAVVLEFDFRPLGNTVSFKYAFSSEEYPTFNCSPYNDVFAFFISGPGYPIPQNIALVPGTNIPVTINSINDGSVTGVNCTNMGPGAPFSNLYINNQFGAYFTHNGFTVELEALASVQPCELYHLKIAIADAVDRIYDSAVFLEANSLNATGFHTTSNFPLDGQGKPFLAEGCNSGSFTITPPRVAPFAQPANIYIQGTATNGVDITAIPALVTIPPNATQVVIPVSAIQDNIPEGTETLKIYISPAGCTSASAYTDSLLIEVRDFDRIVIIPPDSTAICRHDQLTITALGSFGSFLWDADPTLSNINIYNPVASPVNSRTAYKCTGITGVCRSRDSTVIKIKDIDVEKKFDDSCRTAHTGMIKAVAGWEWKRPVLFSLNNGAWQPDSVFTHLAAGNYVIKAIGADNCTDSMAVVITNIAADLSITEAITPALCSGNGQINITGNGGFAPYVYAFDASGYGSGNTFSAAAGTHTLLIKDEANCTQSKQVTVPLNNNLTVDAGTDKTICEGAAVQLGTVSAATSFTWQPAATLSNPSVANPVAKPAVTTKYYVTAVLGSCTNIDSVTVFVRPAPVADAGADTAICFGQAVILNGNGGVSYQWSPNVYLDAANIRTPRTTPHQTVTYRLTVTDAQGCSSIQPDDITVTVRVPLKISAGEDVIASIGQPVQLTAVDLVNTPNLVFSWQPSLRLSNANIFNPVATAESDILYKVTVTDAGGCTGSDEVRIKVYKGPEIYVPGAFSPNKDGRNDILYAIPAGVKEFRYFSVYNKWGQLVFTTKNAANGWDGTVKGVEQQAGAFVWMAEAVDYKGNIMHKKGTVVLVK